MLLFDSTIDDVVQLTRVAGEGQKDFSSSFTFKWLVLARMSMSIALAAPLARSHTRTTVWRDFLIRSTRLSFGRPISIERAFFLTISSRVKHFNCEIPRFQLRNSQISIVKFIFHLKAGYLDFDVALQRVGNCLATGSAQSYILIIVDYRCSAVWTRLTIKQARNRPILLLILLSPAQEKKLLLGKKVAAG